MSDERQIAKAMQAAIEDVAAIIGRSSSEPNTIRPSAETAQTAFLRMMQGLKIDAALVDLSPLDGAIGEAQHRAGIKIACRSPLVKEALQQIRDWRIDLIDRERFPDWADVLRLENDLMRMERNLSETVFPVYLMARSEMRALKYFMHRGGRA
jgi:hypothetical protein